MMHFLKICLPTEYKILKKDLCSILTLIFRSLMTSHVKPATSKSSTSTLAQLRSRLNGVEFAGCTNCILLTLTFDILGLVTFLLHYFCFTILNSSKRIFFLFLHVNEL